MPSVRYVLVAALLIPVLGLGVGATAQRGADCQPGVGVPPPKAPLNQFTDYRGRVIARDDSSITIQGVTAAFANAVYRTDEHIREDLTSRSFSYRGRPLTVILPDRRLTCVKAVETRDSLTLTDENGKITVLRAADMAPSRFLLAKSLTDGGTGTRWLSHVNDVGYQVDDVKTGDFVHVHLDLEERRQVCGLIVILRRPGGRVPRAPFERFPLADRPPHHVQMNALQNWETKGVPLPETFRQFYSDHFIDRPLPLEVAPPPREVTRPPSP